MTDPKFMTPPHRRAYLWCASTSINSKTPKAAAYRSRLFFKPLAQESFIFVPPCKIHNQLKLSALLFAMRSKSNLYPHDYS